MIKNYINLNLAIKDSLRYLINTGQSQQSEKWQGISFSKNMFEAYDVAFKAPIPRNIEEAVELIQPNLDWANEHFNERVSGYPLNPPASHSNWPYAKKSNSEFMDKKAFSHSYPERFFPKWAGNNFLNSKLPHKEALHEAKGYAPLKGIRFDYGDFDDFINLIYKDPTTRQAYLPIYFPEDTGTVHGGRVPCTLGYGVFIRNGHLHLEYNMRATDALRHFNDDIYLAVKLAHHILATLKARSDEDRALGKIPIGECFWCNINLGYLTFHTFNIHVFLGEEPQVEKQIMRRNQL